MNRKATLTATRRASERRWIRTHLRRSRPGRAGESRVGRFWSTVLLAAAWVVAVVPQPTTAQPAVDEGPEVPQELVVVYLVRHAEKADDGTDDPPLSLAGQIRVNVLRQLLGDAGLTHIHTTDFKRTRDTSRRFAEQHGIDPTIYDPRELRMLADDILRTPGRHLVAGHSNTTPVLVAALGGDPFDPIDEYEYDRLYIVVAHPGQPPTTILLRFGEPYIEGIDIGPLAPGNGEGR